MKFPRRVTPRHGQPEPLMARALAGPLTDASGTWHR
jgi:hypothetical protein